MALVLANRVQESATANTTVSFSLAGATTGYQAFSSAIGNANTTYYGASDGTNWEVGVGTYATSGNLLNRTTILSSSVGGTTAATFSGSVTVFCDYPAENAVVSSNNPGTSGYVLTSNGTGVAPTWQVSGGGGGSSTYTRTSFTASASQTTFTVTYTVGYVAVYLNGVLLNAADYTASNGTSVVLAVAANSGDIVETIAYNTTSIGTIAAGGSNTQIQYNNAGNLAGNANFTYTGNDVNIPFGTSNSATSSAQVALAISMTV
jgi:hypothetical protein